MAARLAATVAWIDVSSVHGFFGCCVRTFSAMIAIFISARSVFGFFRSLRIAKLEVDAHLVVVRKEETEEETSLSSQDSAAGAEEEQEEGLFSELREVPDTCRRSVNFPEIRYPSRRSEAILVPRSYWERTHYRPKGFDC